MARFIGSQQATSGLEYIYDREGRQYSITGGMLSSLFKTHGYCVDPTLRTGAPLTPENIASLQDLATQNGDAILVEIIATLSTNKAPSPRMANDNMMNETTLHEKYRFDHLREAERVRIQSLLRTILEIGLYLTGWKGQDEPYLSAVRSISDIVRIELKIFPLIESLYTDPHYPLVKNFPIVGYYRGTMLKPNVIETSLNIDQCLNRISLGVSSDYSTTGIYLISTAYYYITTICRTPLPMIDPLIRSFVK